MIYVSITLSSETETSIATKIVSAAAMVEYFSGNDLKELAEWIRDAIRTERLDDTFKLERRRLCFRPLLHQGQ